MFTHKAKTIQLKGDPDNERPDRWSSTVCDIEKCIHITNIIYSNIGTWLKHFWRAFNYMKFWTVKICAV